MAESVATHDFLGPPTQPGDLGTLAHYRVIDELGKGGMGYVFRAEDSKLQRSVALKVMNKKIAATSNSRQRFLHEARAMAAVRHDNVATIFEVGESTDGTPFMAMEMLHGGTLETFNKGDQRLGYKQIIEYARQIARGLSAAHRQGIVHRDIKPANLWIEEGIDRIKILDFGLALASTPVDHLSGRGAVIGTPGYLAPEQARSEPLDDRSDLYSLGVVLYELATGQLPLQSGSVSGQLIAILTQRPKPVNELNPEIPQPLCDLIHRLLRKEPRSRFQSAVELEAELDRVREECEAKSEVAQAISKLQVGLNEVVTKSESSSIIEAIDEIPDSVPDPLSSTSTTDAASVGAAQSGRFVVPATQVGKPAAAKPNWVVYAPLLAIVLVIVTVLPLTAFFFSQMGRSTEPILVTQLPSSTIETGDLPIKPAAPASAPPAVRNPSPAPPEPAPQVVAEQTDPPVVEEPSPEVEEPSPEAVQQSPTTEVVNQEPTPGENPESGNYSGTSPAIRAILEREAKRKSSEQTKQSAQPDPRIGPDSNQTSDQVQTVAAKTTVESAANAESKRDPNVKVAAGEAAKVEVSKQPIDDSQTKSPTQRATSKDPPASPDAEKGPEPPAPKPILIFRTISTEDGRGADVMVRKGNVDNLADKPTISIRTRNNVEIEHSYIRFDLASIESVKNKTAAAELFLVVNGDQPIDGIVRVYGIANPQIVLWPERRITWKVSYSDSGLGEFPVLAEQTFSVQPESKASRVVRISSPQLTKFIVDSEHDVVTFALAGSDLAGADQEGKDRIEFFSSKSPNNLAPRLRLKIPEPPPPDPTVGKIKKIIAQIAKLRALEAAERDQIVQLVEKKQFQQAVEAVNKLVEKLPEKKLSERLKEQLKKQAGGISDAIQELIDQPDAATNK